MQRMRILVTSFDPFGGSPVNPTIAIAAILAPLVASREVVFLQLPVVGGDHAQSARGLSRHAIEVVRPSTVVHLGEAQTRSRISFERVAINLRDGRVKDNAGILTTDLPVVEGGPSAYFSNLPLRDLQQACDRVGVAQEISLSAGAFLCNEVMYGSLHDMHVGTSRVQRCGFIHVPQLPEQALARGGPSLDAETSARAIHAILECLLDGESG